MTCIHVLYTLTHTHTPSHTPATCLDRLGPTFLFFLDDQAAAQLTFAYNGHKRRRAANDNTHTPIPVILFGWLQLFLHWKAVIPHSGNVSLLHLLSPSSSPAVILLFVSENPRALRGDILPPRTPLPPHAHASLCPPHPQQPHTRPAGTCGPFTQQALLLLLQLLFFLPSLFGHLLPGLLT